MTSATSGFGTLLKEGDGGSPEAFTAIAEVRSLSGPSSTMSPIDVTNHQSTSGWREFVAGLLDGGQVTLDINYLPANATHNASTGFLNTYENKTSRNFLLRFPDAAGTTWAFKGFFDSVSPTAPIDGALTASVSIKITGVVTFV